MIGMIISSCLEQKQSIMPIMLIRFLSGKWERTVNYVAYLLQSGYG